MEPHSPSSTPTFHWRYAEFDDSNFQIHGRTLFFFLVVASLIVFIVLIYVYARWLCRSEDSGTTTTTGSGMQHALPTTIESTTELCGGLDESSFSRIPILLHQSSKGGSETECSICLGIFNDGEKVKVMPECRHCFHSECVDKWLCNRSTCPLCRSSLRLDSLV